MRKNVSVFGILILGLFIGILIDRLYSSSRISSIINGSKVSEVRGSGYKFISPLLECEFSEANSALTGLDPLHDSVEKYVADRKSDGTLSTAAVYFRDLNNGPWFGVDEHSPFSPASLLKLPVMMAYFKEAENSPQLLAQKVEVPKELAILEQNFSTPTVRADKEYTVDDLIVRMIEYSDNGALSILEKLIDNDKIDRVTLDLGVETAKSDTPEDFMSVKGYASLFRILYNASYLTKDYSEKALSILSKTQFKDGILAGVPHDVTVAHKYGERELADDIFQLHDCGIIYYPKHPYLLCIMTRGKDYNKLSGVIQEITRKIYVDLDKKYKAG